MNDLDHRLTDLLDRSATAVDVHPDVEAVLAGGDGPTPMVDLGRRPRDTRRLLVLAAAVAAVALMAGVGFVAARDEPRPLEMAQAPAPAAAPGRFPVLGHLPADLEGLPVEANDGEGVVHAGLGSGFQPGVPVVQATLGKAAADGTVSDVVQIAAGAQDPDRQVGPEPARIEDLGDGYRLGVDVDRLQVHGPGTTVEVAGGPDTEDLLRSVVGTGLTATVGPDGTPVLGLADLPDGYTVIAAPAAPGAEQAEVLVVRSDGRLPVVVETGGGAPAHAVMSAGATITPVDIDGGPGWISSVDGLTRIAWAAPSGVTVSLIAEYGPDEALAIARGVELVDEATWRAAYPEPSEGAAGPPGTSAPDRTSPTGPVGTTEPTAGAAADPAHPLVGQRAPELTGVSGETFAGWAMVLAFTPRPGCAGCAKVTGALIDPAQQAEWEPRPGMWASEDGPDPDRVLMGTGDQDWLAAPLLDADEVASWSIAELPTTVVVGPDGIVRAVFVGGTTIDDLKAAVHGARKAAAGGG